MPRLASVTQRRAILVLGSTCGGACVAYLLMPLLFAALPNEMMRSRVLLDSLHGAAQPAPQMVVLGNSIAMNGIDAKQLSSRLEGDPVVWNLSSTGQLLVESMFIVDECPEETKAICLALFTDDLVQDGSNIPESKLIAYLQYGYQLSESTQNVLQQISPPEVLNVLGNPNWKIALDSRFAIRSAVDISCRRLLRRDLNLAKATTSLFYPSPYTNQQSSASIEKQILKNFPYRKAEEGSLSGPTKELLTTLAGNSKAKQNALYVAILPEHPILRSQREAGFYERLLKEMNDLGEDLDLPITSFISLLDETQFIDHIHPNATGAQILTDALSEKISEWQKRNAD